MAKKSIIERQKKREKLVEKYTTLRKELKKNIIEVKSFREKLEIYNKLQELPRNSSKSRLV